MRSKSNHHLGRKRYQSGIRGLRLFCVSLAIHLFAYAFVPSLFAQKWNADTTATKVRSTDKSTSTQTHSNAPSAVSPIPRPRSKSNRFLIAFDTSAAMKNQMASIADAIDQILLSRASGQLYRGDTLGIWTFDTELYTGNFPLQVWTPEDEKDVVARVNDFVKKQRFGKQSRFDALLPAVHELVKQSDIITIIIISDGQNQMQGTPFDREINKSYQQNLRDMGNEPMPIVTVLQAKGGKYIKHNVTALPWPVIIPELPIPLKDEEIAAANTPVSTAKTNAAKPKTTNQPLIVSGPKLAQPSSTPALLPQPEVKPEAQVTAETPVAAPVPPAQASVTPTPAPIAKVESPSTVQRSVTPPAPVPAPTHPTPPTVASEPTVSPKAEVPPHPTTPVVIPKPSAPEVASAPESKSKPTPADESTPLKQSSQKTESAEAPAKPVTIATAAPAPARPKALLIAAITLVAVALGLIVLMFRRARTTSGPSLITRSINRRK
jgi:hypothetical protein